MGMRISNEQFLLSAIYDDAHRELNPSGEDCPHCGGEGYIEGDCTCGEDTCCCLEPEPPRCTECARFDRAIERYVQVQVLRAMDIPLVRAWAHRKGASARVVKMSNADMLRELHAGRTRCKEFTDQERAESACWVECLL